MDGIGHGSGITRPRNSIRSHSEIEKRQRLHWQSLTTDLEECLALRRYTARSRRYPAQVLVCFHGSESRLLNGKERVRAEERIRPVDR